MARGKPLHKAAEAEDPELVLSSPYQDDVQTDAPAKSRISPPPVKRGRGKKRLADEADADEEVKQSPKKPRRARAALNTTTLQEESDEDGGGAVPAQKQPTKAKKSRTTSLPKHDSEDQKGNQGTSPKKRKTAAEKAAEKMPAVARTVPHALKIGAHVSASGGVHNVIENALQIGANSLACFLKSQRKWANPDLKEEHASLFANACKEHSYSAHEHIVPHGSYLVNLAAEEKDKADQAYTSFLDDLKRCDKLEIALYNFHPGNTNGKPRAEAIARIAAQLNRAHKATSKVVTLLENMAAAPEANTVGSAFEDLRGIIDLVEDKSRVGVCLDTCHAFAAGYDLRTPDVYKETMEKFDLIIGGKYLKAVHLNDSKGVFNSHRDLHQNIGLGFLGLRAFHNVVNDPRFKGVPMVLETPEGHGVWAAEIKLLERLHGMDANSKDFEHLERQLAAKGAAERAKMQEQFEKTQGKKTKKGAGKRKKAEETTDDEAASD